MNHQTENGNRSLQIKKANMKTIALNRLGLLSIPKGKGWSSYHLTGFLAELGNMGFRITNPELLHQASESFLLDYRHLVDSLKRKRGGDAEYVPLFKNFPNGVPDEKEYLKKRFLGFMGQYWNAGFKSTTLENGMRVPDWLFDIYDFGADPISQMQVKSLYEGAIERIKTQLGDSHTEWIDLTLVFDEKINEHLISFLKSTLYARSSIKEYLREDLFTLIRFYGTERIDFGKVVFKETRTLLTQYCWTVAEFTTLQNLLHTPTDVLRLFAALTDSDVGLNQRIRFPKLNRPQRRFILKVLENSSKLEEDFKTYKGLWLQLGRYLHPGEFKATFPKAVNAFEKLRNGKITTYSGEIERLISVRDLFPLLVELKKRPGFFARKLHEVLRVFPKQVTIVLEHFEQIVDRVEGKNLLVMKSYFETINENDYRTVVNRKGKMIVLPNNSKWCLSSNEAHKVVCLLENAVINNLKSRENWAGQKVWVDAALENYTVPLQQRKASDGIITLGRGTRVPVDFDKVLRLFVYWKQSNYTTDLDLSVIQYGSKFEYLGHVSYTQLTDNGIVHSGDLQSAPYGATEFIDISLNALRLNVRYLAVQVHKYCGESFAEMTCHAGWMMRKDVNADLKSFDLKTVVNKFDLNGSSGYAIPIMVDLYDREMILTDLYVSGRALHNTVENTTGDVALLARQLSKFVKTRPTLDALAKYHVRSRGAELVDEKERADITFGRENCTYNAYNIEKILSELI